MVDQKLLEGTHVIVNPKFEKFREEHELQHVEQPLSPNSISSTVPDLKDLPSSRPDKVVVITTESPAASLNTTMGRTGEKSIQKQASTAFDVIKPLDSTPLNENSEEDTMIDHSAAAPYASFSEVLDHAEHPYEFGKHEEKPSFTEDALTSSIVIGAFALVGAAIYKLLSRRQ